MLDEQEQGAESALSVGNPEAGWVCPKCGRVYGPRKWRCDYHEPSLGDRVRGAFNG